MRKRFKKRLQTVVSATTALLLCSSIGVSLCLDGSVQGFAEQEQIHNSRMQSISAPTAEQYNEEWDWKQTAENYLRYVFDTRNDYEADNGDHGG